VPLGEARPPDSSLSMYVLNVRGELARGTDALLMDIPDSQDVLVFTETWLGPDASVPDIPGYEAISFTRPRRSGHPRGGICIYTRASLSCAVSVMHVHLTCSYACICLSFPLFVLHVFCCYFPPEDGRIMSKHVCADMWQQFNDHVADAIGKGHTIVVGDLNARTAAERDFPDVSTWPMGVDELFSLTAEHPVCSMRSNQDCTVNPAGRRLLEMCKLTGMRICNGRTTGDMGGAVTYATALGSSTPDYLLAGPATMPLIVNMHVIPAPVSDHHAILCRIALPSPTHSPHHPPPPQPPPRPPRMRGEKAIEAWINLLGDPTTSISIAEITSEAQHCINSDDLEKVSSLFDSMYSQTWFAAIESVTAETPGRTRRHPRSGERQPSWWTPQLTSARRVYRQAFRCAPQAAASTQLRCEYQRLLQQARRRHYRQQGRKMAKLWVEDPTSFWRMLSTKRASVPVPLEQLRQHFSKLLGSSAAPLPAAASPQQVHVAASSQQPSPAKAASAALPPRIHNADPSPLQKPFTAAEVSSALEGMHGGKALVGLLSLEALLKAAPLLAACVAALFNACATVGALPADWALCSVTAVHKSGDRGDANNYRGIAVGSLLSKLFASILNTRLSLWCETNKLRARGQAGFRKDHRTADQVLVLRTLIEECRLVKDPLFVCFVDFTKAYDTVPRHLLWHKLQQHLGVDGWFLAAIQALYASVPMVVSSHEGTSEVFFSHLGLKQGCPLSPLLFGIYIDDFEQLVEKNRATLCLPLLTGSPVPPVLFADDLGLPSKTRDGLQSYLNTLEAYSDRWGLTVNTSKTKVVVFQSPHCSAFPCPVTYKNVPVEVVPSFRYLGVDLHESQRISAAAQSRADSGQRATYLLLQQCKERHIQDPLLVIKLFKILVLPVMMYGHEVWGPSLLCLASSKNSPLELVFRRFLRRVLGLRTGTPTGVLLAEAGQYPLRVDILARLADTWNRFIRMSTARLAKDAFDANVGLMDAAPPANLGSAPWSSQMVSCLSMASPLTADGTPQLIDVTSLRDSLQCEFIQSLLDSDKSMTKDYVALVGDLSGDTFGPAIHLQAVRSAYSRQSLTQLRTGAHWLEITTATWAAGSTPPHDQRLCRRCPQQEVDDVKHMLWGCTALEEQRAAHSTLFMQPCDSIQEFFEQEPSVLASFARACRQECQRLRVG